MKGSFLAALLLLLGLSTALADQPWMPRENGSQQFNLPLAIPSLIVPLPQDTSPVVHPRLMPASTSWMERTLWGESGIVRKMGIAGDLTPENRKHELTARRTMLTMHQIGGFVSWGLMVASCYTGQRVLDGDRSIGDTHSTLVSATIGVYAATALLAILSPPPLIRRDEVSTTSIHKTLAWVHVAGMILTPIIGSMVGEHEGDRQTGRTRTLNMSKARFHQAAAYTTTAVFTVSMVIMTF